MARRLQNWRGRDRCIPSPAKLLCTRTTGQAQWRPPSWSRTTGYAVLMMRWRRQQWRWATILCVAHLLGWYARASSTQKLCIIGHIGHIGHIAVTMAKIKNACSRIDEISKSIQLLERYSNLLQNLSNRDFLAFFIFLWKLYATLCYASLCYVSLCYASLCYTSLFYTLICLDKKNVRLISP